MKSNLPILFTILLGVNPVNALAEGQPSPDCSTAEDDISKLETQKKSTGGGLLSYTPIGLAVNATKSSDEKESKKQQVEAHNEKINEQIEAIKKSCNIE